jgi:hypothetical protein
MKTKSASEMFSVETMDKIKVKFPVTKVYFISLSWSSDGWRKFMLLARSVLSERTLGDHKSPYLPLIEELCREGDRLLEEARKEKDDLQQQAGIFLTL